ncbi:RNA polymerase II C-terminal domain phosphatase-like 4 [Carex rostrata]
MYNKSDDMNPTLVQLGDNMLIKLRPFLRTFLKEANKLFRMYIYTTREQDYATEVAKLLDPQCVYFPSTVICQSNNTTMDQRGLDIVLAPENLVIILDENEHVWSKHKENLILMKRYSYFADGAKLHKSAPQTLSVDLDDETEPDRTLASVLNVLKRAHAQFFDPMNTIALPTRDVRNILQLIKMEILQDCNIVFSKVFSGSTVLPELQPLWKSAEDMGAKCFHDLNDSVTHVVAVVSTTGEVKWARENNKFVVTPQWIEAANYLWKRQKEEDFPVLDTNDQ